MEHGKLILVNGPTGSGKGSIVAHARSLYPEIEFSVSCTTRTPRPGEMDGVDYHFIDAAEFETRIDAGAFLEWARYGGNYYGTLKSEVLPRIASGKVVILEIEIQGVEQIEEIVDPQDLLTIYVDAGSWEALEVRIKSRAPISNEELAKRHERYSIEVQFKDRADVVISNQNGELKSAAAKFAEVIRPFIGSQN